MPSLGRQRAGELASRAVPKFPDSDLPFAAHLAVTCCSLHHHQLLTRGAEQCQKRRCNREKQASLSRSPPDTAMTYLAAAAVPAALSGHTETHGATRKSFLYFQEGLWTLSPLPTGTLQHTAHTGVAPPGGDAKPSKTPSLHLFPSVTTTQETTPNP